MKISRRYLFLAFALALPVLAFARLSPWLRFYKTPTQAMIINPYVFPSGGGGGSFSPTDISGCVLWLPADHIVGLSDGDPVAQWDDESGNGYNATQSTGSAKPTYKTGQQNGLPAVQFDGGDTLTTAAVTLSQPYTIFVVCSETSGSTNQNIIADKTNIEATVFITSNNLSLYAGSTISQSGGSSAWLVGAAIGNGASSNVFRNGSSVASGNPGTQGYSTGFIIGAFRGPVDWFHGYIAEIICYDSSLSTGNREAVENYLGAKYGITITH